MLPYCLKKKKNKKQNTEIISSRISKTNNGKKMILSKCVMCDNKKSRFITKKKKVEYE